MHRARRSSLTLTSQGRCVSHRHAEVVSPRFSYVRSLRCTDVICHSRMQCETVEGGLRGNRLIANTAMKMLSTSGIRAFYKGLPMGLVGVFPYAAIDLGTFEYLKRTLTRRNARRRGCHEDDALLGSFATAGIGAVSGTLGASIVYPLNLLRTRLQAQGTAIHPATYTGILDVTRKTVSREGIRGLFKGLTPNLLKVVPAVSIVS